MLNIQMVAMYNANNHHGKTHDLITYCYGYANNMASYL